VETFHFASECNCKSFIYFKSTRVKIVNENKIDILKVDKTIKCFSCLQTHRQTILMKMVCLFSWTIQNISDTFCPSFAPHIFFAIKKVILQLTFVSVFSNATEKYLKRFKNHKDNRCHFFWHFWPHLMSHFILKKNCF